MNQWNASEEQNIQKETLPLYCHSKKRFVFDDAAMCTLQHLILQDQYHFYTIYNNIELLCNHEKNN